MTATASKKITLGVEKIEYGAVDSSGGMPSTGMVQTSNTYRDSVAFDPSAGEVTDFFTEENDFPEESIVNDAGEWPIGFDILTPTTTEMAAFMGGTEDLTGATSVWKASTSPSMIFKALRITPKKGYILEIPRALCSAVLRGGYKKSEPMLLHIDAKAVTPFNSSGEAQSPVMMKEKASS